jgi:GH18 family chitinase
MKKITLIFFSFYLVVTNLFAQKKDFKVIAYVPSWKPDLVDQIPYEKLTHINFSFLKHYADGSLRDFEPSFFLEEVVQKAHAKNVKVLISVGGWDLGDGGGVDDAFEEMASKLKTRQRFIKNLSKFVDTYKLDGVDIDWEFPDLPRSGVYFDTLMMDLWTEFHPKNKLVTCALVPSAYNGKHINSFSFQYMDFMNIMAYDGGAPHSSYQYGVSSVEYWVARGLPKEKAILGLPFYGRNKSDGQMAYNEIVNQDKAASQVDITGDMEYNGQPTIRLKTQYALQNAGGVMFWEMSQDTFDETSLLKVIYEEVMK